MVVASVAWTPVLGERSEAGGQAGEIVELEARSVLAWTWGEERYRFELEADGHGCLLVFIHVFDASLGSPAQHAAGWEAYLNRLEAHLGGGHLSEEQAHEPIGEVHELYANSFGVDPAPGRSTITRMHFRGLTLGDGPVLRLERRYGHSIERIWHAITDPDERGHWFPSDAPMEIARSEPPRLLVGTWFGDQLRFELRPEGEACVLVFTHAFAGRDTAARTAAGWDRCFARLDALLASHPMNERESLEDWLEVHERYAQTFGVDPEIGRRAHAQHPLT